MAYLFSPQLTNTPSQPRVVQIHSSPGIKTGLNNRRGFLTLSEQYLKIARRQSKEFVLVFADIDGLKNINDTFGHDMGARALIERPMCSERS
ncbi:MAG: hypothetical protein A2W01_07330 [Candidatus Solincola sediminis]|uniref:GGDEF domain-containing protein n=1 Tax=Candidatus Solincola sediminis TaxID=1797199 RepID=A0A1F2WRJ8_9ACTN|nr:MAG: hypothetical protein A2Y75_11585 [Candidatus Solincola sediminis]OFW59934.1 MAG: hypothetical protein A2W01_07330 [Candidatus Solincola sediminis]